MKQHTPEELKDQIDRLLSEQPLRQAPTQLTARVFALIEQRAQRTWWQRSFAEWPIAARAAFYVLSAGLIAFALEIPAWLVDAIDSSLPAGLERGIVLLAVMTRAFTAVVHSVPAQWMYAVLAIVGTSYLAFFGISAAAYRTLYVNR